MLDWGRPDASRAIPACQLVRGPWRAEAKASPKLWMVHPVGTRNHRMTPSSRTNASLGHGVLLAAESPLSPIFAPRSVALLGATERPGSVGCTILRNLLANPFGGTIYPVNPRRPNVLGVKS